MKKNVKVTRAISFDYFFIVPFSIFYLQITRQFSIAQGLVVSCQYLGYPRDPGDPISIT